MNLYVGNLPYRISEDQLKAAFEEFGQVSSCTIIKDKVTGQSKGFGFLEMPEAHGGGSRGQPIEQTRLDRTQDQCERGSSARETGGGGNG